MLLMIGFGKFGMFKTFIVVGSVNGYRDSSEIKKNMLRNLVLDTNYVFNS